MKRKKIAKRLLAVICAVCMVVTTFSVSSPSVDTALAAEDTSTSQVTGHTELTNITLTDLGISAGTTKEIGVEYENGFNNTVLSFYDTITYSDVNPRIHIGGRADARRQGLIFLINPYGNFVISGSTGYSGDTANKLDFENITVAPSTLNLDSFFGQKILIEVETTMSDNDVTFKVSLNKTLVATIDLTDSADKVGTYLYICDGTHNLAGYKEFTNSAESRYDFWTTSDVGLSGETTLSGKQSSNTLDYTLDESYFSAYVTINQAADTSFGNFYLGAGDWNGVVITHSGNCPDGFQIGTVPGSVNNGYITSKIAGVTLRQNRFKLGISVKYLDVDTEAQTAKLKIGVWINDVLYNAEYFTTSAQKIDSSTFIKRIHTQSLNTFTVAPVTDRPEREIPSDFTRYTLADTAPTFATVNANTGDVSGFLPCESLDKVVYSTWIKYTANSQQFHYAAEYSDSYSGNYGGITFYPSNSLATLNVKKMNGNLPVVTASMTAAEVLGQDTFANTEFLLQITTEYGDYDYDGSEDDIKVGIWFNGTLYHSCHYYYIDAVQYIGTRVNANESGAPQFCSYYEELPESMEAYAEWSFETVNMPTPATGNWTFSDMTGENIDRKAFRGYVTFDGSTQWVLIGYTGYYGIGYKSSSSGNLDFGLYSSNSLASYLTITPEDCGLQAFAGNSIELGIITRLLKNNGDGTILVEAIPTVGGKIPTNKSWIFTITSTRFTQSVAIGSSGTIVISSTDCEAAADDLPDNLTVVNMNDLGLEDTLTDWTGTGYYDKLSFDDTIIPLTVNFGTGTGQIRWGQQAGVSSYLGILLYNDGTNIKIGASTTNAYKDVFQTPMGGLGITVTPASVNMTTFASVDIEIDLVTQYIDLDYDGLEDDLKYGVYINDVLVNGHYNFVADVVPYLGAGFNVHTDGGAIPMITTNGVTVKSLNEDDYTSYTLTDAGIKDGKGATYGKLRAGKSEDGSYDYIAGEEYNKVLFGAKVKFADTAARINYASPIADTENAFDGITIRLYESDTTKLRLQNLKEDLTYDTVDITASQFDLETFNGTTFKLQLTTNVVNLDSEAEANDIQLGIWINGELANNRYVNILDQASILNCYVNFNEGNNTEYYSLWDITAPKNENTLYYKINAEYSYLVLADNVKHNVTGATYSNGCEITVPGDYTATYAVNGELEAATQSIVLWAEWDASADGEYNVKDLIALKKMQAGVALNTDAGQMAASKLNSATALTEYRSYLVGKSDELSSSTATMNYDTDEDGTVMPIGAWITPSTWNGYNNTGSLIYLTDMGMETNFLQTKYYDMIQDLGINVLTYNAEDYNSNSQYSIKQSLALAEEYNLKAYVQDSGIANNIENIADLAKRLNLYSRYSSFAGLHVYDEPESGEDNGFYYTTDGITLTDIQAKASLLNDYSNLIGNVNLYPAWDSTESAHNTLYASYLSEYIEKCDPKELSFDDYPFSAGETTASCTSYFNNLALVRNASLNNKIPFVGYIGTGEDYEQTTTSTANALPTAGQLKWNVNTLLAYGAKGYNWFTLIQPWYMALEGSDGSITEMDFDRLGLIGADGSKTRHYDTAKEMNAWVGVIDSILMEATSTDILATGNYAQNNTGITKITDGVATVSAGNTTYGAIVGVFDYLGKNVYYVVNNNDTAEQTITLNFSSEKTMSVYNSTSTEQTTKTGSSIALTIETGGAALVVVE